MPILMSTFMAKDDRIINNQERLIQKLNLSRLNSKDTHQTTAFHCFLFKIGKNLILMLKFAI